MDVNGTRFHLLLGEADWRTCAVEPEGGGAPGVDPELVAQPAGGEPYVTWDAGRVALTLWPRVFQFKAPKGLAALEPTERRGAARDRFGNWFWIDEDEQRVLVSSSGSGQTTTFWPLTDTIDPVAPPAGSFRPRVPPPAPAAETLRGLAVTGHHYLVVGTVKPEGILVFDLHAGGPPEHILWPTAFAPFDMAPAADGGLWILDRDNRTLWGLDCHLKVLRRDPPAVVPQPDDFQNRDGSLRVPPRQRVPIAPVALGAKDPIAVEALADGTVLVLDRQRDAARPSSAVLRYRYDAELGAPQFLDVMGEHAEPGGPVPFELLAHDFAVAGGRLYAASKNGAQAFAFDLVVDGDFFKLVPASDYYPMRFFGKKALVAAGGRPFYDFAEGWIDLVAQPRARYREDAVVTTRILDGKEPGCVWHRLLLDAAIPGGSSVEVWSRASDERADLEGGRLAWSREPSLAVRPEGPEIPFAPRLTPCPEAPGEGTWELLFQRARGRYAELRLRLAGDGTTTPALRALRAYYPRFSYLASYLPAAYREDPESASFLDRFLALFEGFYTSIEDRIAATQLLLDVRSAPADGLDWLASFFGVALDPAWDDARRRLFLRHAMDFFRARGTIRGLQMALELAIARCPSERIFAERAPSRPDSVRIIEKFRTRRTPGVVLGDPTDLDGIRALPVTDRWKPEQGGKALLEAWREALAIALPASPSPAAFPILRPYDGTDATWTAFCRRALGFVPSATEADKKLWDDFLQRAYVTPDALNHAWGAGAAYTSFAQVAVPSALPPDGAALADWYRFEGVLAVRRTAHRFVVALPVPPEDTGNAADYQERRRLAERLVALEKPSHTVFEVRFYWAMFRVGDARIAIDTQIHQGSRAPELLAPMVLGERYLAESYLAPRPPQDAADRRILGRDPIRG